MERSPNSAVDGARGTPYAWLIEGDLSHGTQEVEEEVIEEVQDDKAQDETRDRLFEAGRHEALQEDEAEIGWPQERAPQSCCSCPNNAESVRGDGRRHDRRRRLKHGYRASLRPPSKAAVFLLRPARFAPGVIPGEARSAEGRDQVQRASARCESHSRSLTLAIPGCLPAR